MCTASTTTAGTGIVEVKYWYDEVGPYADSCQMAILEVDPTPTSITLEPDEEVVVDAQAVPNPADVGAILEWSMDWESGRASRAKPRRRRRDSGMEHGLGERARRRCGPGAGGL